MPQYLLSVHSVEGEVREPMTEEEMQRSWKQVSILEKQMMSAGAWVFSGRLHEPDTATVVRVANDEVLTTDGPFVEAKEHLGGFYIIEARDLDAALAWASKTSTLGAAANLSCRPARWNIPARRVLRGAPRKSLLRAAPGRRFSAPVTAASPPPA